MDNLNHMPVVFELDFGLSTIPTEPGIFLIRGPWQYGKSTWLEQQLKETIKTFGPGSAFYLNGDEIKAHSRIIIQASGVIFFIQMAIVITMTHKYLHI